MSELAATLASISSPPDSPAEAAKLARQIDQSQSELLTPSKLHVVRTSTLEPLSDFLIVEAALAGFKVSMSFAGYERLPLQIAALEPNQFTASDVIALAPELADLEPQAAVDPLFSPEWPQHAAQVLAGMANHLREKTTAKIIVVLPTLSSSMRDGYGDLLQDGRSGQRLYEFRREAWSLLTQQVSDCAIFDSEQLVREVGLNNLYDERMWQGYRTPYSSQGMRALGIHLARIATSLLRTRRKCLVLDCDNTLWGDVIGEVGKDNILLAPEGKGSGYYKLQSEALALSKRGVLLALLSKNQEPVVLDALATHPHMLLRPEVIAAHSISFGNKAQGIRQIAQELNIGLDALVFVDDSAEECELIRQLVPEVVVYQVPDKSHKLPGFLLGIREFDVSRTLAEDHAKTRDYQAQKERAQAKAATANDNIEDYLRSLAINVQCLPARDATLKRVAQMESKTNQFNTTTQRFSHTQLQKMIDAGSEVFAAKVADRFGDYGVTVACTLRINNEVAELISFLMSCRIIGLGAESALLEHVANWARSKGCTTLRAYFKASERNAPASDLYEQSGLSRVPEFDNDLGQAWDYDLSNDTLKKADWIDV